MASPCGLDGAQRHEAPWERPYPFDLLLFMNFEYLAQREEEGVVMAAFAAPPTA